MAKIHLTTMIYAPIERCFDLSRSIDFHLASTKQTNEQAIRGRTTGLIELNETVTWRAKHFWITQELTSKVTSLDYPTFFADEMVSGAFKSFRHEHLFIKVDGGTMMNDNFTFESPFGLVGRLFNLLILKRYMTKLLTTRNDLLKQSAENESNLS